MRQDECRAVQVDRQDHRLANHHKAGQIDERTTRKWDKQMTEKEDSYKVVQGK